MTSLACFVRLESSVLFRDLGGEAVLLETESGKYYGLNEVGTRIWQLLPRHQDLAGLCRALEEEYDFPQDQLRAETLAFIDLLASKGLVRVDET